MKSLTKFFSKCLNIKIFIFFIIFLFLTYQIPIILEYSWKSDNTYSQPIQEEPDSEILSPSEHSPSEHIPSEHKSFLPKVQFDFPAETDKERKIREYRKES